MKPRISIIVAVYNAEKTLRRCIDSLIGQTLQDLEILLIDDGSSDSSLSICEQYVQTDSRIHVWHKQNEGVSKTKQLGLDNAHGEYIIYLDSDDYVDKTIYQKLSDVAARDNADIVCCDILRLENGGTRIESHKIPSFEHEVFLDGMIDVLFGSICNRIIRRTLFEEYQVRFDPKVSYGEDKLVLVELLSKALSAGRTLIISYVPEALLYYDTTANPTSLMKLDDKAIMVARIRLWEAMGKSLDLKRFGKTYYGLLVKYGFKAFWKRYLSRTDFESLFSNHVDGLRTYAPRTSYTWLVLMASSGRWEQAQRMRWLVYGRILSEKIRILFSSFKKS